ncbi:MAG: PEP-CTERM sorting domain-containing protein [Nitrosospira sp.]
MIYHEHDVTLAVVSEPESWAMLPAGLGLMGTMARQRRT